MSSVCKTVIDSIGTYLPTKEVTTAEIMRGCVNPMSMPLERLTGIHSRRRAGETEFAIDLAYKAALDCLNRSQFAKGDIEVIVSTNISRWDGVNQVFFEPATSCRLKKRLGLSVNALTIDISNACAGMWTGVFLVDALIRSGEIRCGMVVSGEYITHLIDTAQKEVVDFMDSQIASLTLGDAGAAVILTKGKSDEVGLIDFDLYTLSKYSPFCIAKPTAKSHGGAAMLTDAIRVTEAIIPHAAKHAQMVLRKNNWKHEQIDHLIPHQTSELTMKAGIREIRKLLDFDYSDRLINNLKYRGNTSSNAHFLALHDSIHGEKIQSGQSLLFCISGSGQSTGTALYVLDDMPDRMRANDGRVAGESKSTEDDGEESFVLPIQLSIEAMGIVDYAGDDEPDTVQLLAQASEDCLKNSAYGRSDVDLMIAACTFRSEFIMEPAIAALTAGVLKMNDEREPQDEDKTFAFDITNSEVGFLKSVYLAGEFVRVGRAKQVMVVASEVENNIQRCPESLLGIRSMASAIMLRESEDESGFTCFDFTDYPNQAGLREVHAGWHENGSRIYLTCNDQESIWPILLDCLVDGTNRFLTRYGVELDSIDWVLPTQQSTPWMHEFADRLKIPVSKILNLNPEKRGNPLTSSLPLAITQGLSDGSIKRGQTILVANVSPGVQVGCAVYRV